MPCFWSLHPTWLTEFHLADPVFSSSLQWLPLATLREHSQDLTSLFLIKGLIDYWLRIWSLFKWVFKEQVAGLRTRPVMIKVLHLSPRSSFVQIFYFLRAHNLPCIYQFYKGKQSCLCFRGRKGGLRRAVRSIHFFFFLLGKCFTIVIILSCPRFSIPSSSATNSSSDCWFWLILCTEGPQHQGWMTRGR